MTAAIKSKSDTDSDRAHPDSGTFPAGTARQMEEHRQLGGWIDALREKGERDAESLRSTLDGLRFFLLEHFVHEESHDGLFTLLRETRAADRNIEALRQEHVEMLQRLDRLMRRLEEADASVDEMTRAQIGELVSLIEAHEEWENALLQEALMTDFGGSG